MMLPAFLAAASAGGLLAGLLFGKYYKGNKKLLSSVLFLPFVAIPAESFFNASTEYVEVNTSIVINASQKTVWNNITSVSLISPSEIKPSIWQAIGMPAPLQSKLINIETRRVRQISWAKGIRFEEVITKWKPLESFSYKVKVDTIPPGSFDNHIQVGGQYFDVIDGGYHLKAVGSENTLLNLRCRYRVSTTFNFYCKIWSDWILDDFQQIILTVVKNRSEKTGKKYSE